MDLTATVAAVVGCAYVVSGGLRQRPATTMPTLALPTKPLAISGAPSVGSRTAQVALIEFSDFDCPFCAKFSKDTRPILEERYGSSGQVLFVFKQLPLPIHPEARVAAAGSLCAAKQGKFAPMRGGFCRCTDWVGCSRF
jgi:protein-disulfide isomerase